jgi:hypothetical protein
LPLSSHAKVQVIRRHSMRLVLIARVGAWAMRAGFAISASI